jgi:hypothetical protein
VAITLGKDATLTVGDVIASVRNVTWTATARTIEVEEFGVREQAVYSTGWAATVSFEINDDGDMDLDLLFDGTLVAVSGGEAGWSFNAVVTGITETNPLDGATSWTVECALTRVDLREE